MITIKGDLTIIKQAVIESAKKYDLSPHLIAAVIWQESRGNKFAYRYEDGFFLKYVAAKERTNLIGHVPAVIPTLPTEKRGRSFSWGLMQIMGQTAREQGFVGDDLTELLEINTNIDFGAKHLAWCLKQSAGDVFKGRLRW